MNNGTIQWLLQGEPWIKYQTRVDLLGESKRDPQVIKAPKAMIASPKIKEPLVELADWPGVVLNSHKSAGQPFHKLAYIARIDLFRATDPKKSQRDLSRSF